MCKKIYATAKTINNNIVYTCVTHPVRKKAYYYNIEDNMDMTWCQN